MPRLAPTFALIAALGISLNGGCATRQGSIRSIAAGTVSLGVSYALGAWRGCGPYSCASYLSFLPFGFSVTGIGLVIGGGTGLLAQKLRRPDPIPPAPPVPLADHPLAEVGREMHTYAEAGDCHRVQMMADELWEIDEDYRRRLLEADPLVKACVSQPE